MSYVLCNKKTLEDLQTEEDKVNHLTKTNSKLNTQVNEARGISSTFGNIIQIQVIDSVLVHACNLMRWYL